MVRGEVYWIKALVTTGSEQAKRRPGVIIQNDIGNKNSTTVIIAYVTSNVNKNQNTHSKCKFGVILTEQITTICKSKVDTYMGTLTRQELVDMELALSNSLSLKTLSISDTLEKHQELVNNEISDLEKQSSIIKGRIEMLTNKHIGLQYALEALSIESGKVTTIELDAEVFPIKVETKLPTINNPLAREIVEYMLEVKKEVIFDDLIKDLKSKPSRARVSDTIYKHLKSTGIVIPVDRGTYKLSKEIMEAL